MESVEGDLTCSKNFAVGWHKVNTRGAKSKMLG
jgi:hypothetical protein